MFIKNRFKKRNVRQKLNFSTNSVIDLEGKNLNFAQTFCSNFLLKNFQIFFLKTLFQIFSLFVHSSPCGLLVPSVSLQSFG